MQSAQLRIRTHRPQCRRYFLLASALWGVAIAKRAPLLGRSDVLQNAALLCWLLAHVALVRCSAAPAARTRSRPARQAGGGVPTRCAV